jgi:hypothetical protein
MPIKHSAPRINNCYNAAVGFTGLSTVPLRAMGALGACCCLNLPTGIIYFHKKSGDIVDMALFCLLTIDADCS